MAMSKTPQFGRRVSELPHASTHSHPAPHWQQVAAYCQKNPDVWCEVKLAWMNEKQIKCAAHHIRKGRYKTFASGEYDAQFHDGILWVRYTPTGLLKAVM